ncbi:MAG: amino acid adenylation domain-containing protein [Halanaerobiales bacterium]|nr:amino acid adenylation domain-containing protein [Halanaerobiales bacterium]
MSKSIKEYKNKFSIISGAPLSKKSEILTLTEALIHSVKKGDTKGMYLISSDGSEIFFSYSSLLENAKRILKGLKAQGVKKGDKVIIEIENDQKFFCVFWASILGGIIPAPISTPIPFSLDSQELQKLLKIWSVLEKPIIVTDVKNIPKYKTIQETNLYNDLKFHSFQELLMDDEEERIYYPSPDEIAFLQFSSGSTGDPKGVILTHQNLIANIRSICESNKLESNDISVSWLPHTHDMGLIGLHLLGVYSQMNQVKMLPQFFLKRPLTFLKKITEHKGTLCSMPNFGFSWILEKVKEESLKDIDLSSLRVLSNGAEPISSQIMSTFVETFKKCGLRPETMSPVYGMAEASLALCFTPLKEQPLVRKIRKNDFYKNGIIKEQNINTDETIFIVDEGFPIPGVSIRVVDENDKFVEEKIVGNIQVKGPNVTRGYINNKNANQNLFCDGWLRTGDMGFIIDGRLTVSGRRKDIIFVNGKNFYSYDIEEAVYEIKKIRRGDVAAIGVHNFETDTENIIIFIKYKGSIKKFLGFHDKITKIVNKNLGIILKHVIPVNKISKTTSGKLQRYILKENYLNSKYAQIIQEIDRELKNFLLTRKDIVEPENELEEKVRKIWAEVLNLEENCISVLDKFAEIGGNSVKAVQIITELEKLFNRELSHEILIQNDTIHEIAVSLEEMNVKEFNIVSHIMNTEKDQVQNRCNEPFKDIAVVGISLRLPDSNNVEEFWEHLLNGKNLIRKIPSERKTLANVREWEDWLGYINDVDKFDAEFFNISEEEARFMDPQQRLMLEVVYEALEDWGTHEIGRKKKMGVFIGATQNNYNEIIYDYLRQKNNLDNLSPSTMIGNILNMISARISHTFDFTGPALTIDTACSSSLTALYYAIKSLRAGEIETALVGGASLILTPTTHFLSKNSGILSNGGECKAFGADSDGTVLGEGIGVILLQPLEKAIQEKRQIYGVIKGIGINNDGSSLGIMAPNPDGQLRVLIQAYYDAGIDPRQLTYIETHGAGTKLGDPVEVKALSRLFKDLLKNSALEKKFCGIGSVKSNIGHLLPAAGIAGLIKTLLSLKYKKIVPSIHAEIENPLLNLDETPFYVPKKAKDWKVFAMQRRVAGISSFGFGGTNVHVVVEEPPYRIPEPSRFNLEEEQLVLLKDNYKVLPISAKSQGALYDLIQKYKEFLLSDKNFGNRFLYDICYNSAFRRYHYDKRIAFVGKTVDDFIHEFDSILSRGKDKCSSVLQESISFKRKVAFVFTGQGNQWFGMGKKLFASNSVFRKTIEKCDQYLKKYLDWSLVEDFFEADNQFLRETLFNDPNFIQPLIFAIQIAITQVWESWGIVPNGMIGHSFGEIAATYVAGVLSLEDAIKVIINRSRLMQQSEGLGKMVAVELSLNEVKKIVSQYKDSLSIAVINSDTSVVLSGQSNVMAEVIEGLKARGVYCRYLKGEFAVHNPLMELYKDKLIEKIKNIAPQSTTVPLYSTVTGKETSGIEFSANYWGRAFVDTVQFKKGIDSMVDDGFNIFIEIGPSPDLFFSIYKCLNGKNKSGIIVPSLRKNRDGNHVMYESLGKVYSAGVKIEWQKIFLFDGIYVKLPTYPWQRNSYWLDVKGNKPENILERNVDNSYVNKKEKVKFEQSDGRSGETFEKIVIPKSEDQYMFFENYISEQISQKLKIYKDKLNLNESLISFGLDSMAAVQLKNRIYRDFGISISMVRFLEGPTISELATTLFEKFREVNPVESQISRVEDKIVEYNLSHGQQALWFLYKLAPETTAYNLNYAIKFLSELDFERLKKTLEIIAWRHPILRTVYLERDGKPVQKVKEDINIDFKEIDASNWDKEFLDEELSRIAQQVFDLEAGPVWRVVLFTMFKNHHILLFSFHHIAVDLWSLEIIMKELLQLYNAEDLKNLLPSQKSSYFDFVLYQSNMLTSEKWKQSLDYWKDQLKGELLKLNLPIDYQRPDTQTCNGSTFTFELGREASKKLKDLANSKGVTVFTLLLAIYKVLLYRHTNQNDIIVGSPTVGRSREDFENVVGYFVNPVPIRSKIVDDLVFEDFLKNLYQKVIGALENQDYPFNLLVDKLQLDRDLNRSPIFQTMLVMEKPTYLDELFEFILSENLNKVNWGKLTLEPYKVQNRSSRFDLTLLVAEGSESESFIASFEYNTDLFNLSTIERFADHFKVLAESIIQNPELEILKLPILTEKEYMELVYDWNDTDRSYRKNICVHQLFEEQVEKNPELYAVCDGAIKITYAELNRRANQLACYLKKNGVGSEIIVGICLERSIEMIIGMLAILKAGGVYLPIDATCPEERILFILEDAKVPIILSENRLEDKLGSLNSLTNIKVIEKGCVDELTAKEGRENLLIEDSKDFSKNPVYVIYTSGSTGTPKGVVIEHKSLVNMIFAHQNIFKETNQDRMSQIASSGFDACSFEIWSTLSVGAELYIVDDETRKDPFKLMNWLAAKEITKTFLPTPLAETLLSQDWSRNISLKSMRIAGDKLHFSPKEELPFIIYNLYGPTEATIWSTYFELSSKDIDEAPPIGRPIENVQIYILDEDMKPCSIGVKGEIYIGGKGVARGYLNKPDLTNDKFVENLFVEDKGARLYKTGDLGYYLPDQNIVFVGRKDYQVKIRGYRIELEEIETVLNQHPVIKNSVVLAKEKNTGEKFLIGYIVLIDDKSLEKEEIINWLKNKLPDYMIPAHFMIIDHLLLTSNGKIDRKALPNLDEEVIGNERKFTLPRNKIEEKLASIWSNVLGINQVGIFDTFFELGGNSITAIQLISRIRKNFTIELPVKLLFKLSTIAKLAEYIDNNNDLAEIKIISHHIKNNDGFPLSSRQKEIYFSCLMNPESPIYIVPLALHLRGALNIEALKGSIKEIIRRHDVLRSSIKTIDGIPKIFINSLENYNLPLIDFSDMPKENQDKEVFRLRNEYAYKPFELAEERLVRSGLLKLNDEEYILLLTIHHFVFDGWSIRILIKELSYLYQTFLSGKTSELEDLSIQYVDFTLWEQKYLQGENLNRHLLYWKNKLNGKLPILKLPADYPRPDVQTMSGEQYSLVLSVEQYNEIKDLCQKEQATTFMVLLTVFKIMLYQYTKEVDILVGTRLANRRFAETEELIGCFINTVVLRSDLSGNLKFRELLSKIKETTLEADVHQDIPISMLVKELELDRNISYPPLFQVLFNMLNYKVGEMNLPDLAIDPLYPTETCSKLDLNLYAEERDRDIKLDLVYNPDLFSKERMVELLHHYLLILEEVIQNPEVRIEELSLPDERFRVILPESLIDVKGNLEGQDNDIDLNEIMEPINDLERIISDIWKEVLQLKRVDVDKDFYELGGDSFLMIQVYSNLQKVIKHEFKMIELFKYLTIDSLAKYLNTIAGD